MPQCERCNDTKEIRIDRGDCGIVIEPCSCIGKLHDCVNGHQLITYRGEQGCPLCAALTKSRRFGWGATP